ncbi:MAG: hypothetical protein RSB13_07525 [Aurantimicrobium sp.]
MEAVYFAFGLLALALVLGILLKKFAPKDAPISELAEAVAPAVAVAETPAQDDFKHITALRASVAAREESERLVGPVLLSSGVNTDAHEHIREMVARLQSLSGTPTSSQKTLENV